MWASMHILTKVVLKIGSYMMYYTHNGSDTICDILILRKNG
jgi:hypothetical protein